MALINCPECGRQVSASAHACPSCGYPVAEKLAQQSVPDGSQQAGSGPGEPLAEVRMSWWAFFWHFFFFWLIIPPIIALLRHASTVMRIYPERIAVERGLFSKCYQDYNPKDIRSIDVDQAFLQRLVGIGDLTLSTSATIEAAEKLTSIPDPKGVRDLILSQRNGRS